MNFKPRLLALIKSGVKTQTRRRAGWGDQRIDRAGGTRIVDHNTRERWARGKDYAACPGRGKRAECRIRITGIKREQIANINLEDARAEGFDNIDGFLDTWRGIYGNTEGDCWVLEFELIT